MTIIQELEKVIILNSYGKSRLSDFCDRYGFGLISFLSMLFLLKR